MLISSHGYPTYFRVFKKRVLGDSLCQRFIVVFIEWRIDFIYFSSCLEIQAYIKGKQFK